MRYHHFWLSPCIYLPIVEWGFRNRQTFGWIQQDFVKPGLTASFLMLYLNYTFNIQLLMAFIILILYSRSSLLDLVFWMSPSPHWCLGNSLMDCQGHDESLYIFSFPRSAAAPEHIEKLRSPISNLSFITAVQRPEMEANEACPHWLCSFKKKLYYPTDFFHGDLVKGDNCNP